MKDIITLAHGSGGQEMDKLIASLKLDFRGDWKTCDDDSATLDMDGKKLVFTTDSFIVDPIFFPGGDIGHLAVCGTINDLLVMGARPLGLSLAFVIEEGFPLSDLERIMVSIREVSREAGVPVVTGDTKVMENGKLDRIIVNVSGVGLADKDTLLTKKIKPGDKVIISGGIGEHAVALLSRRFDYETTIVTDSKHLTKEFDAVRDIIKAAKDVTRGGLAAVLNELSIRNKNGITLYDEAIPAKAEVVQVTDMLGINIYDLACEGRFVCIASKSNALMVVEKLKKFNELASIIGDVTEGNRVVIQTILGRRILPKPRGRIVPRIC